MLKILDKQLLDALGQQTQNQENPITIAILLLDASSSMRRFGGIPFSATNDCIESLRESPNSHNSFAGIWSFSNRIKTLVPVQPVSQMQNLEEYVTDRGTILYQALAEAIEASFRLVRVCKLLNQQNAQIDITLITDGYDSMSKNYHEHELLLADQAQNEGIRLHAIGIGIDHKKLAEKIGFDPNMAHYVQASNEGVVQATSITRNIFLETMTRGKQKK